GPRRFARRESRRTFEGILVREFVGGQILWIAADRGIAASAHDTGHGDQPGQVLVVVPLVVFIDDMVGDVRVDDVEPWRVGGRPGADVAHQAEIHALAVFAV